MPATTAPASTWSGSVVARQAIPPSYTEWIGRELLRTLEAVA